MKKNLRRYLSYFLLITYYFLLPPPAFCLEEGALLYHAQTGDISKTVDLYKQYYHSQGRHNSDVLQQLGLILLAQGHQSKDPNIQLMTMFGAGISTSEKALYILEEGIRSPHPQLQLVALNLLARIQNDRADDAIRHGMSSNFVLIRLEAAYHLTQKKHPHATGQLESLMNKVDPELHPLFSQLFAQIGDANATKMMRKLLNHPSEAVRLEAILSVAKHDRDDFLPQIRLLASHHDLAQQETAAYALGTMKDKASLPRLETLSQAHSPSVQLAAWQSLTQLGIEAAATPIKAAAKSGNLFAINILGDLPDTEEILYSLTKANDLQIRTNASLALLNRQDPRCLSGLYDILLRDSRDLALIKIFSPGKALSAWKVQPSARQTFKDNPIFQELAHNIRESFLNQAASLPESNFLQLANTLFEAQENALVPTLVELLQNLQTPQAIQLLKKHQQKVGAPLIRNYCNLALYRLNEPGPYQKNLEQWLSQVKRMDLIQLKPLVPWELSSDSHSYQLTPEETSRLFLESLEALAERQDEMAISILLDAIQNGNPKNRYALAGLLIRITQ